MSSFCLAVTVQDGTCLRTGALHKAYGAFCALAGSLLPSQTGTFILVDSSRDGNTSSLLQSLCSEKDIPLRYIRLPEKATGKAAFRAALRACCTQYDAVAVCSVSSAGAYIPLLPSMLSESESCGLFYDCRHIGFHRDISGHRSTADRWKAMLLSQDISFLLLKSVPLKVYGTMARNMDPVAELLRTSLKKKAVSSRRLNIKTAFFIAAYSVYGLRQPFMLVELFKYAALLTFLFFFGISAAWLVPCLLTGSDIRTAALFSAVSGLSACLCFSLCLLFKYLSGICDNRTEKHEPYLEILLPPKGC